MNNDKQDWTYRQIAAVFAILVAGLAVRLYQIDAEGLWFDEISSYGFLEAPSLTEFFRLERGLDAAMLPVYFAAEYYWARLVGDSVLALRLLSLLAGMATILMIYLLGRRLYGHWAGCIAALGVAFSKIMIYQSQEIRMYPFVLLFSVVSAYGLVNAVDTGKKRWWACNIIANALAVSTHLFAVLFVGAQFAFLLFSRPRRFRLLATWAAMHVFAEAIALVWFMTTDLDTLDRHIAWIYKPGLQRLFDAYYFVYAGSKLDAMDLVRDLPFGIPVHHLLGIFIVVLAASTAVYSLVTNRRRIAGYLVPMVDDRTLFTLCWLILPPFALFFLTYTVKPCFVERYTLYSSFPLYILAGAAVARLRPSVWRFGVLAALLLVMMGNLVDLARPMRPDWRSAGPMLQQLAQRDATVFSPPGNFQPTIAYYGGFDESRIEMSEDFIDAAVARFGAGEPAAIAFFEVPDLYEAQEVERRLERHGIEARRHQYPGRWDTFVWELGASPGTPP